MKHTLVGFLFLIVTFTLSAQGVYKVDPAHSKLGFTITHLGIADVPGHFDNFDVTVQTSKADFSDAKVEMTAKTESVNTRIDARDKHLKSPDFFNVEKHPEMSFKSTSIKPVGKNKYELSGNLTLNGVTKPVTVNMWHRGSIQKKAGDKYTAGLQFTASILRSDFNLGNDFPAPLLSDEVTLKGDGEFLQQ